MVSPGNQRVQIVSSHFRFLLSRGVGLVVRERGGTPFRQIFRSRNGAPANIVGRRWNANTEAFRQITSDRVLVRLTLDQFISWPKLPPNAGFGIKKSKKTFPE